MHIKESLKTLYYPCIKVTESLIIPANEACLANSCLSKIDVNLGESLPFLVIVIAISRGGQYFTKNQINSIMNIESYCRCFVKMEELLIFLFIINISIYRNIINKRKK